jgi:cytochrome c oxidase assembly factor CtaG
VLTAWNPEPTLVLALAVTAAAYVRGWRRLRARRPERAPLWRLVAFLGGLAALFMALASPLDAFAGRFLAVHMGQHIVLLVVVPPLLLLGAPAMPLLYALPGRGARRLGAGALRLGDRLAHPLVAWAAMSLAVWGWHLPVAFELALRSRAWHVAEHASFLAAGLLFWWPVVQPWPSRQRWPRWTLVPYLLLADVQNTALAAILTFSDRVLYPSYAGPGALDDQVAAGVLMWVPMSLAYLVPAAVVTMRWLSTGAPEGLGPAHRRVVHASDRGRAIKDTSGSRSRVDEVSRRELAAGKRDLVRSG